MYRGGIRKMELKALTTLSYGLYLVSSVKQDKFNGQIANSVFQITSEPTRLAISLNKSNLTYEFANYSKWVAISVLSEKAPMSFIGRFGFKSGRDINKFEGVNHIFVEFDMLKLPVVLDYCVAFFVVKVVEELDMGTHSLFISMLKEAKIIDEKETPMSYSYYHKVKGGFSPETAPTYINIKEE